jgi:OmpA-OmpF porin, OOP family
MASLFQRIVLVALVTCVGLFAGLVIGAAFFVPPDSGLAGPAIVVVWGLGGAVLALIGSAVSVKRLEPRGLRRGLVIAGAIVAAIIVWIGVRMSVVQAQSTTPPQQNPERVDLLTFAQGAVPVSIGGSGATLGISFEAAIRATDGNPLGFTLTQKPGTAETDFEFVYQLPASTIFDRFAVPNVLETPSPNVTFTRLVEVHGSTAGPTDGFTLLASATLSTHQKRGLITELTVHSKSPVRWVKLRLVGGIQVSTPQVYFEFSEIVGNGTQETAPLANNFRGVWKGRGVLVELEQDGPLVTGCYDRGGQLTGTVTGNILRATGVAQVNRIPSAFILNVAGNGELRGVRSTNGGPFALLSGEPASGGTVPTCSQPPAVLGCGSVIHGISFDFDSAAIRADSAPVLTRLFDGLRSNTSATVVIEGHTSNEGTEEYNRQLSERRAQSVVQDLVKRGIEARRLQAAGIGETRPIAGNGDESGRSLNRRVEVRCKQ